MVTKVTIEAFKSIERVEVELALVNVFVGANGSGKSNLLESIGVLSAAASGRVDDEALLRRGVRPGLPRLYRCALKGLRHSSMSFSAECEKGSYKVSLLSPMKASGSAWRYQSESWTLGERELVGRSEGTRVGPNPEAGLAALRAVDREAGDPALMLLDLLRNYAIYEPNTPTLRGITPELQPRDPVGLSGGGLPQAIRTLIRTFRQDGRMRASYLHFRELIDWAKATGSIPVSRLNLSPSAATSRLAVKFVDRYMKEGRNVLSGTDASEGALYVLFAAVMALDSRTPKLVAIDNIDHGLNPRLAQALMRRICDAIVDAEIPRQLLLTTHNPQALDGLPLKDDRVRLFTVSRSSTGRTIVRRVIVSDKLIAMSKEGWTLSRMWVMGHLGGVPNV